jgi:lysophospholipase L1-like esterase
MQSGMKQVHIACLGDSLTYGYGVRREESWVALAGLALAPGVLLRNHGVNGDTTAGMRERLAADVLPDRPDAVLLMGGANDIAFEGGWSPATVHMPDMVRHVAANGAVPLIGIPLPCIPPPADEGDGLTDWHKAAREYDAYAVWLREFCASSGTRAVDFRARFDEDLRRSGAAAESYFFDGLHYNAAGHLVLAACMAESVNTLLAEGVLSPGRAWGA